MAVGSASFVALMLHSKHRTALENEPSASLADPKRKYALACNSFASVKVSSDSCSLVFLGLFPKQDFSFHCCEGDEILKS